eukprot:CAMPEP_0202706598 /NCGR_PEP_ID=MMETSP1385-20130828/18997_1 /ASSEMBLY_ACC=CAM_ASM_000861 /TAXON_ID=933848 /ORGANISM="Elphidium margaritaceum" /LENGTH=774 /DNA_ID=CAMNT_0049365109 /DNA_START=49 /DNA_END=2373 /DNA_ORIENTATION=-
MSAAGDDTKLFRSIGLKDSTLKNIGKNASTASTLKQCIADAGVSNGCDASVGKLIFDIATAKPMQNDNAQTHRKQLLSYVANGGIQNVVQLAAAYKFITQNVTFDAKKFEQSCGVGVVVTEAQITQTVDEVIAKYKTQLSEKGKGCLGVMFKEIKSTLPWADGKQMSAIFNAKFKAALQSSGFDPKKNKCKKEKKVEEKKQAAEEEEEEVETMDKWLTGRELEVAKNSESQLAQKKAALAKLGLPADTFLSRFPPEPNGFLHIGHCKAMTFNFTLADSKSGSCYLRFDDTNPTTEKQEFIDSIVENVTWMGFAPWKVSYSSDYFRELHELALRMIRNGDAYVCHQSDEQVKAERDSFRKRVNVTPSPYRDRSVAENLRLFELMRCGYFAEGEATLRMKGDFTSANPNMWDHIAYRIMYAAHPKSGDAWCIYPTYDYTHCIVDSLEWITASCCTLEFENRRESYFWLLDVLDLYKPVVWEYSRLNLTFNVLSKRKLLVLVNDGYVRGWDDPRMLTVNGLRRRGFSATILRDFCNRVGVTRKDNFISPALLYACARDELNRTCSRAMAVIEPLKIVITNYDAHKVEDIECPDFPNTQQQSTHCVKFSRVIYIDASDFQSGQAKNKKFYGLSEAKSVRLKYAYQITCKEVVYKAGTQEIDYLRCEYDAKQGKTVKKGSKGFITWVSEKDARPAEFRLYEHLFTVEKPGGDDWLKLLNPQSELICKGFVSEYVASTMADKQRYQFERYGYFVRDPDSDSSPHPVFNRTCILTESAKKK